MQSRKRVLVLGASGTIGKAVSTALCCKGHDVVCLIRETSKVDELHENVTTRICDIADTHSIRNAGLRGERFDALISCIASRHGGPEDAWAVDYQANVNAFEVARSEGVKHAVLLSAICVQKPRLHFQHAKLAAEKVLISSGMDYSIVRPTAYFKSLSGQISRLRKGKAYLMFGNGKRTATKPISDRDLGQFIAMCIEDPEYKNRILPIGGPGPAITPEQQGEHLFQLLDKTPRFKQVPPGLLNTIAKVLGMASRIFPSLANKAEFARIGHYYATESMLVWNESANCYDEQNTPCFGEDTLFDYYEKVVRDEASVERGEHSVFS